MPPTEEQTLRQLILTQRRITRDDYQRLRLLHSLLDDPAASMVWRLIKTYERHAMAVLPLSTPEIAVISAGWPDPPAKV